MISLVRFLEFPGLRHELLTHVRMNVKGTAIDDIDAKQIVEALSVEIPEDIEHQDHIYYVMYPELVASVIEFNHIIQREVYTHVMVGRWNHDETKQHIPRTDRQASPGIKPRNTPVPSKMIAGNNKHTALRKYTT